MTEDDNPNSAEYMKFKAAMLHIVSVRKADIAERLPEMFRERTSVRKAGKKRGPKARP